MKHKLLALFTLLFVTIGSIIADPISAVNEDGVTVYYDVIGGEAWVTKPEFGCYSGNVTIPARVTLNGIEYPVTLVRDYAFADCADLTAVKLPETITSIGGSAFKGCSGLTSCNIPASVEYLGNRAFAWCSSLTSIKVPATITSLDESLFFGCSGLTSVELPNTLTWISISAFEGCSSLTSIDIPASVEYIGEQAFADCTGLTSIELPQALSYVYGMTFRGCTGLKSVKFSDTLEGIGGSAFSGCTGLTSIVIPASVNQIWEMAFNGCTGLTSVTVLVPEPSTIMGSSRFTEMDLSVCTLYVPFGSKERYAAANEWKRFSKIVELPESSGIDAIDAEGGCPRVVGIRSEGGCIEVAGTVADEVVGLFDLSGKLLCSVKATSGTTIIPFVMSRGKASIVKVGTQAVKHIF